MRKLLLIITLSASVGAISAALASAATPVYIASECRQAASMPHAVDLACADDNLYVTRLVYKHYGQKTAAATGLFHENDCTPDCAAGHFHSYQGTIAFRDLVRCKGKLFYSVGEYKFAGPGGSGKADVEPLGVRCTRVKG